MIRLPFTKAQGAGNDFLIVEGTPERLLPSEALRRRVCDRHYGAGADGIAFLAIPGTKAGVDADLRLFNSDGGEAEISGNGTRCAAAYLVERGCKRDPMIIGTQAGVKKLRLISHSENHFEFEMAMGTPIFQAAAIPFCPPAPVAEPIVALPLPLATGPRAVTVTSMGNPHCSVAVDGFDWDWPSCGREIEQHPFFPRRANVEFYRVVSKHEIEVRFWERGVGETLSSGTGSCAAAVSAILNQCAESPVTVRTLAGDLPVRWEPDGVFLIGPAEITLRGEISLREES